MAEQGRSDECQNVGVVRFFFFRKKRGRSTSYLERNRDTYMTYN